MLSFLPSYVKGCCSFLLYTINSILLCLPLFLVAGIKFFVRIPFVTDCCAQILVFIASLWISINSIIIHLFNKVSFDVRGLQKLEKKQWYLVLSNHQSWVDILVLQKVLNKKVPMLKFFLKKELIWIPFLGLAWWALDFPFMKRYSRKFIMENPHLKGEDFEKTKKACEKFKASPVSIMNFVEGTRFTQEKKELSKSKFKNLLQPKAGGVAFVLGSMDEILHKIINVTIVYPSNSPTLWNFMSGKTKRVIVDLDVIPVSDALAGDFFNDNVFKDSFYNWLNNLWEEKDKKIEKLLKENNSIS
ncbi:MAG: acyltransferase [Desulfobacteraceae bacterium]|nr:acyltransferase [Desulfobacteraceae bacterium]